MTPMFKSVFIIFKKVITNIKWQEIQMKGFFPMRF